MICVAVAINHSRGAAIIDSGSSVIISPQKFGSNAHDTVFTLGGTATDVGGHTSPIDSYTADKLTIGNYELDDLPIYVSKLSAARNAVTDTHIILGNEAFSTKVLTIDWQARQLKIYDASYNFAAQPLKPNDVVVNFDWIDKTSYTVGFIGMHGSVAKRPTRFLFDTGWGSQILACSPTFSDKIGMVSHSIGVENFHAAFGEVQRRKYSLYDMSVSTTASPIDFSQTQVTVLPIPSPHADAVFGASFRA